MDYNIHHSWGENDPSRDTINQIRKTKVVTHSGTIPQSGPGLYSSLSDGIYPLNTYDKAPPAEYFDWPRLKRPPGERGGSDLYPCRGGCCPLAPGGCWGVPTPRESGRSVMGRGLVHNLPPGPLPTLLLPTSPRLTSLATLSASPALIVVVTVIVIMILGVSPVTDAHGLNPSGSSSDPQRQGCNIEQCWNLYQSTQDYYNIHFDYDHPSQLDPEKLQGMCMAKRTFYDCLKVMYSNKSLDCHSNIGFRSAFNGIERSMEDINCSREGPVFDPSQVPTGPNDRPQVCTYNGPPTMRYCALFGDPHLRTFQDEFETCQIQGAWPLLDNRYLTIQVTSQAVGAHSGPATAITELTVMIRSQADCAENRFVTYQAEAGFLPPMFDDGSVHFGPEQSVTLEEIEPNRHIEIYLRYINTRVVVRHYPNIDTSFLTVALLMPEKILNQSVSHSPDTDTSVRTLELCSQGCPDNQKIDYTAYLAGDTKGHKSGSTSTFFTEDKNSVEGMTIRMTQDKALRICRLHNLVDFYLDSCVFDLMNTGDMNFSQATADALADTIRLHPDRGATLQNRTKLHAYRNPNSSASATQTASNLQYMHRTTFVLLVAVAACLLNSIWWSSSATIFVASLGSHTLNKAHQGSVL